MRISEMMNHIEDDTVHLDETSTVNKERIKQLVYQRMNTALPAAKRTHPVRTILAVGLAAAMVLSLATTALAVSRGVSVAALLSGYFGGALNEEQQELLEELGTTDFSEAQERDYFESLETSEDDFVEPVSITHNGVTITPLAVVFDGYRSILKIKIALPEGQCIEEESPDCQYSLLVNFHVIDQVWVPAPSSEAFSKEGCQENEIICTQDWSFGGQQVILPDSIDIVGMEITDHTSAVTGMVFGDDKWTVNIRGLNETEEITMKLEGQSFPRTIYNSETDATIDTVIHFTNATITPLTLTLTYAYEEELPYEIIDRCGSDLNFGFPVIVMEDGSRIVTHGGSGWDCTTGGQCYYEVDEPLVLDQIEAIEFEGLNIEVS